MLVYAVPDDLVLGQWLSSAPTDATSLIRMASALVRHATRRDLYDTEPSGLPADDDIAEAMRDATCAQAAMWSKAGIDPVAGSVGRVANVVSQTADGGSVTYGNLVTSEEITASVSTLCDVSLRILQAEGLCTTRPVLPR